jgi:O-acetyl-ADP-ribose deacetylase (regulator of RNase III)
MKRTALIGNIAWLDVDVIVNAANQSLTPGGGVCGAIHRAAGPELHVACERIGRTATGAAVITPGYLLKARHVIHAVGPVWDGGTHGEPKELRSAYLSSLRLAAIHGLKTIAFPCISTGIYGYPPDLATDIAIGAVDDFERTQPNASISEVVFCCYMPADHQRYVRRLGMEVRS